MSFKKLFFIDIIRHYVVRLFWVFLLNLLSVVLTIFVFLMIEPFCRLLFYGDIQQLSPISSFAVSILSSIFSFSSVGNSIAVLVAFAILLFFLKTFFAYSAQWMMAHIRSDAICRLRNQLFHKILILPIGYFTAQKRGDVVSCAVNDTQEIEFTILNSIRQFMTEPITALIYLAFLFYLSPRLTLYSLLLLPVTFLIIGRLSISLRKSARVSKQRLGSLLSHVEETLDGLRVIKSFNAQANSENVFHDLNEDFTDAQTGIYRRIELSSPLSEFLGVTVVMVVLIIGGTIVLNAHTFLTPALFITYIALFSQIITPIKNFSTAFSNYRRGQAVLERIDSILSADEVILQPDCPVSVSSFKESVRFSHVSFSYNSSPVLNDINFTIHKGDTVALVGQSGSGKTTLSDILERFYDPSSGAVILDGIDIRKYDISDYRSLFSLVSQDVVLFNDTLYNNITMGYDASEEQVLEAVRIANIEDFVLSLPDGLNHRLSDRGLNLSGGQRQRISIARAVLRNSPIIILDEATSAMDTESEQLVQKALDNAVRNRTVLVIAHRLSTIQNANLIIVLDKGAVVEQGTHQELLAKGGLYNKLIQLQNLA